MKSKKTLVLKGLLVASFIFTTFATITLAEAYHGWALLQHLL